MSIAKNTLEALELEYDRESVYFQPWNRKTEEMLEEQKLIRTLLRKKAGAKHFGKNCFIARGAKVFTQSLEIGGNSIIAAGAILRGHVKIGSSTSVNPYAHIAGKVTIGSGVRIAGAAAVYGFNHGFDRTDIPIYRQAPTSKGIRIGDGTWIGTNAVILDGCNVGAHCIVAAGAVVTKDVPDYAIVGGNPARILKQRKPEADAPVTDGA